MSDILGVGCGKLVGQVSRTVFPWRFGTRECFKEAVISMAPQSLSERLWALRDKN